MPKIKKTIKVINKDPDLFFISNLHLCFRERIAPVTCAYYLWTTGYVNPLPLVSRGDKFRSLEIGTPRLVRWLAEVRASRARETRREPAINVGERRRSQIAKAASRSSTSSSARSPVTFGSSGTN